jgi:glyoxylase-like metal-dependent hydrolase (beta-lactamase superfamily II)
MSRTVSAADLAAVLGTDEAPVVLDVREPDEFASWAISGARNLPLSQLGSLLPTIELAGPVIVVCASGARSARALEALRAAGVEAVNLEGGMEAWSSVYDTAWCDLGPVGAVQVRRRGKGCLSYVLGAGGEAFVVDPSSEIERYLAIASEHGWRITRVFDTHLHADHVSGARSLAGRTGAKLHLGKGDPVRFPFDPVADGERLDMGEPAGHGASDGGAGAEVTVLDAPGHTKGSLVLEVAGRALLSGDTLFVDGVGRPDLADEAEAYAGSLFDTLQRVLGGRQDDTVVFPAHYSDQFPVLPGVPVSARLGDVRSALPQLGWDRARFVSWASGRAAPRPPRYQEIVRVNTGESTPPPEERRSLELGPNRCAAA